MSNASLSAIFQKLCFILKKNYQPKALKKILSLVALVIILDAIYLCLPHFGYLWTWTSSLPVGLWRNISLGTKSPYVAFCLENPLYANFFREHILKNDLKYDVCPYNMPLFIKPIMGYPGDHIQLTQGSVVINQKPIENSAAVLKIPGKPISVPQIPRGTYTVQPGTVWVFSTYNKASFDSRYYGAIPLRWVRNGMEPAFVYTNDLNYKLITQHPLHCLWRFCWS